MKRWLSAFETMRTSSMIAAPPSRLRDIRCFNREAAPYGLLLSECSDQLDMRGYPSIPMPRFRPSVETIAMVRTTPSPICCCTLSVRPFPTLSAS